MVLQHHNPAALSIIPPYLARGQADDVNNPYPLRSHLE